jgi:hypothetical protein
MRRDPYDYEIGYKRPPEATRWEKGQSGNPERRPKRDLPDAIAIMDRMFAETITVVEQGVPRTVSVFEAILMRIWAKEMSGNKRAAAVRLKYQSLIPKSTEPREIIIHELPADDD